MDSVRPIFMLIRLQWLWLWAANGLNDYFIVHWPWQIVLVEQLLFLPLVLCCPKQGVIETLQDKSTRSGRRSQDDRFPSRVDPPVGYTGPFWNKPSATYLESRVREGATAPSIFAPLLLLVPFAVIFYLLLRH